MIFTTTGGSISGGGLYTTSAATGTYRVIVRDASGAIADTCVVTVATTPPPPNGNGLVSADYFAQYATTANLQAKIGRGVSFLYYDNIDPQLASIDNTVKYNGGNTMKYTFPASSATSPQLVTPVRPLTNMWLRVKIRFSPGFTTTGEYNGVVTAANPTGYYSANAYKFLSWAWEGLNGRSEIMITNTNEYQNLIDVFPPDYGTTGGRPSMQAYASAGRVSTEWSDGGWYDYIIHYEILTPLTARQRLWIARDGSTPVLRATSNLTALADVPLPPINRVQFGRNFNQLRKANQAQYIWYGQWEIYDGKINARPFGVN